MSVIVNPQLSAQCSVAPVNVQLSTRIAGTSTPPKSPAERPPLAADRRRRRERVEVALGEAQVPDRPDDPAVLDEERPVAGHAGDDRELRVDRVRVVEAGDEQAALEAADQLARGPSRRRPSPCSAGTGRTGSAPAGRGRSTSAPARAAVWASYTTSRQTPRSMSDDALLRDALVVERHRQRRPGPTPSSTIVTRSLPIRLPGSANERSSWTASALKPDVAEQSSRRSTTAYSSRTTGQSPGSTETGFADRPRLLGRLATDRRGVDRRGVDRGRLGVAGRRRPGPSTRSAAATVVRRCDGSDPLRVRDRDRLGGRRERSVGDDAGRVGGRDDRPDALGPELRRRVGGRVAKPRACRAIGVGPGRPPQSSSSSRVAGDRRRPSRRGGAGRSSSSRLVDATPTRLPMTNRRLIWAFDLGDVLVDLAVGEARQARVVGA